MARSEVSIEWDEWGVPTVTGSDDLDVCYGAGYAQATAHATQVLELYGIARGRAAALWGESFVAEDMFHVQLGLGAVTDQWWAAQEDQTRTRIDAYVDGFNAACEDNPDLGTTRREVLPVTSRDVIAQTVRTLTRFGTMDGRGLAFAPYLATAASNGWAVSAKRSATGRAMLCVNPHLGWSGFHRWFEFRSISPGRSFHGVTLLGLPWQTIGFNEHTGWTHTVNPVPLLNAYALDLADDEYPFDGETRRLEIQEQKIEVRGSAPVTALARRSVHGPVVTAPDGADVAVRIAGITDSPATAALEGWWQMSVARDVHEVVAAARRKPLPMFNLLAADSDGAVAAAFCATPAAHEKATFDDLLSRLPGDDPAYLWTDVHPATSMPQVIDPECGWVQNVNETPWWYCHPPLDPTAYPSAIAPPLHQLGDTRSPYSRDRLETLQTISPDDLLALKWSTRVVLADVMLDELCAAARQEPDLVAAADVLSSWDRFARADSPGYPLFYLWLIASIPAIRAGTLVVGEPSPGELPTRLGDPADAVNTLRVVVGLMDGMGLPINTSIGEWVQMREGTVSVPADGGTASAGVLKDMEPVPVGDGWSASYGDTWVALVEFQPDGPPLAQGLLVYGNTSEPSAPSYRTQIDLFAQNKLRPIPALKS